jgi:hypothetical protein
MNLNLLLYELVRLLNNKIKFKLFEKLLKNSFFFLYY